jgi:ABC-type multidrug transport system fused ATPase/permease subunit
MDNNQINQPSEQPVAAFAAKPSNGLGIAAFVVGIVAVIGAWIPLLNIFSFILGLVALILGIIALVKGKKRNAPKGLALAGVIIAGVAIIVFFAMSIGLVNAVNDSANDLPTSTSGTTSADNSQASTADTNSSKAPADTTDKNDTNPNVIDGKYELVGGMDAVSGEIDNYGYLRITGTLKNLTEKKFTYASVDFIVYDESGAQIGTALANMNYWEPGGTWTFEAVCFTQIEGGCTYKLTEVTAF